MRQFLNTNTHVNVDVEVWRNQQGEKSRSRERESTRHKVKYYSMKNISMIVISQNSPAGKLSTPAPTIDFTRLNTSLGMEAVPPPFDDSFPLLAAVAAAAASDDIANTILPF